MKNSFLTVRHFADQNALKTYGHDGPLKPGQDDLLATTEEKIMVELRESQKKWFAFFPPQKLAV